MAALGRCRYRPPRLPSPSSGDHVSLTRVSQNDGVRALQIQTHDNNGTIHVCHSSCSLLDGGTLQAYLTSVASWISSNPNDVVSLVMVNIDNLAASRFATVFQAAGLDKKAYSPSKASLTVSDWPSLGTLIDAGTTLVVFMDNTASFTDVPYIIDEFSNLWEDAYGECCERSERRRGRAAWAAWKSAPAVAVLGAVLGANPATGGGTLLASALARSALALLAWHPHPWPSWRLASTLATR